MNLSEKELRKLLNKAWDEGGINEYYSCHHKAVRSRRYRDVTKIIKKAKEKKK